MTKPPLEVVAALIQDGEGRFLAGQRPAGKARGLLWEFVGGKVEPGETGPQALVRECREELGVLVTVERLRMELVHRYPDLTVHLALYEASIAEGVPRALAHTALRYFTMEEAERDPFSAADREILERMKKEQNALPFSGQRVPD